jgi:transposase
MVVTEIDRNGAISKCGDALLRATLYQAALALLTHTQRWSALKAGGVAVAKRRGLRRAVAAVARKLAVIMHRIWADGTKFHWSRKEAVVA